MAREISESRKLTYYVGMAITILGVLMFASVFVSGAMHFGDFHDFHARNRSMMFRGFGGMALIVLGAIVSNLGARGLAGSGVVLDPERARGELEPYSRMAGGMLKDALEEGEIRIGATSPAGAAPEKVIMVRCQACGRLNEEDSKFCQECGRKI